MKMILWIFAIALLLNSCGGVPTSGVVAISYTPSSSLSSSSALIVTTSSITSSSSSSTIAVSSMSSGASSSSVVISYSFTAQNLQACTYDPSAKTLACAEQTYLTTTIGSQNWMAENLNFIPSSSSSSWCYGNADSNCTTYGRLYDWMTANEVCPTGWHLPDTTEWNQLVASVSNSTQNDSLAGKALKANSALWTTNTGTNTNGFTALPGGSYYSSQFYSQGAKGYWWTASFFGYSHAYERNILADSTTVEADFYNQANGFSVRCIMNAQ